jgi:DNA-binding transcriptional MerR regulator
VPEPLVEIPDRPLFRASEVCEIAQIPPYVLKSWEKEFPGLGTAAKSGGARVYRRADVEQVVKIKHLLFAEGLTLAGARRRLEGDPRPEEEPLPELPVIEDVRDKVVRVRQELQELLALLSSPPTAAGAATGEQGGSPSTPAAVTPAAWPPVAPPADPAREGESVEHLPLLNGVPEDPNPPKPARAPRRVVRRP